ncbi:succinate dehydrogenase assembly factor 2 [Thioclava sp. A2]|uniref:FAD assembly factor SdhE n=1 Tax=Thioclava sp. FCG-A2 TaxID=3080562 RepID=UPI00295451FF|nr:succinate dehydrogenase assembly factor 2 [Thioclava sp. A2]MDV7271044.1 succinate dehydrogenase assembly factor 2 [Thioclava sp. A2]
MSEPHEARLKRMKMRAWRRGTKEMDLILGPYADTNLEGMDAAKLDLFDALLEEYDQDLYPWVSGTRPCPPEYLDFLTEIAEFAKTRHGTA